VRPVTTFQALLDDAAAEAREFVSCTALCEAVEQLRAPPAHLALFGRRGVGKSSLVRALTGADAPVGLGGVTRDPAAYEGGGLVLVDLPGAEDVRDAGTALRAVLGRVDAVVWMIDGLAPISELERQILAEVVAPPVGLHALIARADLLEPADHAGVVARVIALTRSREPLSVAALDARRPLPATAAALAQIAWLRSPRRLASLVGGLRDAQRALEHLPEPVAPGDVAENLALHWRDAARTAFTILDREVLAGRHRTVGSAVAALHSALVDAAVALDHEATVGVAMPFRWRPSPPDDPALDLRLLLSGTALVRRELRAYAADQASAGEIACRDLARSTAGRALAERRAGYRRAYRLVAQALRGLGGRLDALGIRPENPDVESLC